MANTLFPQPFQDSDSANFGQWLQQKNSSEYVVDGMEFTPQGGYSSIDISNGKARLSKSEYTATQTGTIRDHGIQFVADMDPGSVALESGVINYIYVEPNFDGDPTSDAVPSFVSKGDTDPPSDEALLIGVVDPSNNSFTLANRKPDAEYGNLETEKIDISVEFNPPRFGRMSEATDEQGSVFYLDGSTADDEGLYVQYQNSTERVRDAETLGGIDPDSFARIDDGEVDFPDGIQAPYIDLANIEYDSIPNQEGAIAWDDSEGIRFQLKGVWNRIYTSRNQQTDINGNDIWHSGNDGAGSGLDADTLDKIDSTKFFRSDQGGRIDDSVMITSVGGYHGNKSSNEVLRFTGKQSDALFDIQGGHGRVGFTWNATFDGNDWRQLENGDGSAMLKFDTNGDHGVVELATAPNKNKGDVVDWSRISLDDNLSINNINMNMGGGRISNVGRLHIDPDNDDLSNTDDILRVESPGSRRRLVVEHKGKVITENEELVVGQNRSDAKIGFTDMLTRLEYANTGGKGIVAFDGDGNSTRLI